MQIVSQVILVVVVSCSRGEQQKNFLPCCLVFLTQFYDA